MLQDISGVLPAFHNSRLLHFYLLLEATLVEQLSLNTGQLLGHLSASVHLASLEFPPAIPARFGTAEEQDNHNFLHFLMVVQTLAMALLVKLNMLVLGLQEKERLRRWGGEQGVKFDIPCLAVLAEIDNNESTNKACTAQSDTWVLK